MSQRSRGFYVPARAPWKNGLTPKEKEQIRQRKAAHYTLSEEEKRQVEVCLQCTKPAAKCRGSCSPTSHQDGW